MEDTIKETVLKTFADYYAKGDFLNAWLELEKHRDSISPGLWHFNAGTLKAKMSQPAEARFHFLRSRSEGFRSKDLETNLTMIEDQLEIAVAEKPLEVSDYGIKFALWAQHGFFTTISLLILIGGLLILKQQKKFIVLVTTVFLMMIPVGANFWVNSWDKAVNLSALEVLEGPSVIFPSRGELPPGVLLITRKAGEWYEILYPSRFRGWVKGTGVKELE